MALKTILLQLVWCWASKMPRLTGLSTTTTTTTKPGSCQPICGIIIGNKSFSSAKAALVCSFHASGKNCRHLGCRNVMRSRGCAVQNKGITLSVYFIVISYGILLWDTLCFGQCVMYGVACSRPSDSGVRRELRERGKSKEEERTLIPYPTPHCFPAHSYSCLSPLSQRQEQATYGESKQKSSSLKRCCYFYWLAASVTSHEYPVSQTLIPFFYSFFYWPVFSGSERNV